MIYSVDSKCWILALFIRDDGQRFVLGDGNYEFQEKQLHFVANNIVSDTVEVQGGDGIMLAGQVKRAASQSFDGYISDFTQNKTETEQARRDFIAFFAKDHFYTVVYVMSDGSAYQRKRGFIVDAPEVKEIDQISPKYHVALNFEDVNYYTYNENPDGSEFQPNHVDVSDSTDVSGGLIWDNDGAVWADIGDDGGAEWEAGAGGVTIIINTGISTVYPTITIDSTATNPTIENLTTGSKLMWAGTIADGQQLVIDGSEQTAKLNGLSVIGDIEGDWIELQPGENRILFTKDSGSVQSATISWAEIVG